MGDLAALTPDRCGAFKTPGGGGLSKQEARRRSNNAGQMFRFVHEMNSGHLVAYPSKRDRQVSDSAAHEKALSHSTPPKNPITRICAQWLCTVPRTKFSQGALYAKIGSALAFIS